MTPLSQILLASAAIVCAAIFGYQAGWRARDKWGRSSRYRAGEYSNGNCVPLPPAPPYRRGSNPLQQINDSLGFTEGPVHRGNGNGGLTTPKPDIIPKPQFPPRQIIREDFLQ